VKCSNEQRVLAMLMLLLPVATAVLAQSYKPALEYASLMNLPFCEASRLQEVSLNND
jgi:hypothetical protein